MWKTVTVPGHDQTLINLDNVAYLARVSRNQTEIRFTDREAVIYAVEDPATIEPGA